jgi:hypothetical protein
VAAIVPADRRAVERSDRRKHSRSGRRADDPRKDWRRFAWLFAAYAVYRTARSAPVLLRRLWRRESV